MATPGPDGWLTVNVISGRCCFPSWKSAIWRRKVVLDVSGSSVRASSRAPARARTSRKVKDVRRSAAMIVPADSSVLRGARSIHRLRVPFHRWMIRDPGVLDRVARTLLA